MLVKKTFFIIAYAIYSFSSMHAMKKDVFSKSLIKKFNKLAIHPKSLSIKAQDGEIAVPKSLANLLRSCMNIDSSQQVVSVDCSSSFVNDLLIFMDTYHKSFKRYFKSSDKAQALSSLLTIVDIQKARQLNCTELGIVLDQLGMQSLKKYLFV